MSIPEFALSTAFSQSWVYRWNTENSSVKLLFSVKSDSVALSGYVYVCPAVKDAFVAEKIGFKDLSTTQFKLAACLPKMSGCHRFEVNGAAA